MDFGIFEEAGIGGATLTLYLYFAIEVSPITLDYRTQILVAIAPVAILILLIDSFNDAIMKRVAGEEFLDTIHQEIRDEVGSDRFYYDYEDKQEKIDELDRKSVGKTITIFTGLIIVFSLPVLAYLEMGRNGILASVVANIPIFYTLVYQQRKRLRKIIKELLRLYD